MNRRGIADVVARVSDAAFGKPLVTNVLRGHVVEAIVSLALEPDWHWCAADYSSWDFERADGIRLEVKQSAFCQSWTSNPNSKARPGFDVRAREGRWEGAVWIGDKRRSAHLYIFCWHDRYDDGADHRDPAQWQFFVVPAASLPAVKRLALGSVRCLDRSCLFDELSKQIDLLASCVSQYVTVDECR